MNECDMNISNCKSSVVRFQMLDDCMSGFPEKHVGSNPKAFKSEPNLMPSQNLDGGEIAALISYLRSIPRKKIK